MADDDKAKGGGKLKLIIIIVVAVLLAIALSVGGTLFFLSDGGAQQAEGEGNGAESDKQEHVPATYFRLEEPLVVAIQGERQRYAQISLAIVMRGDDVSSQLEQHLPTLRSRLQSVLQRQDYAQLHATEEKEALAQTLLETINSVLEEEGGAPAERVLFTNFVMQ